MTPDADFYWDTSDRLRETAKEMRELGLSEEIAAMIDGSADDCDRAACGILGREAAA